MLVSPNVTVARLLSFVSYRAITRKQRRAAMKKKPKVEDCVICLEALYSDEETNAEVTSLRCGHRFHTDCIRDWMQTNTKCPYCRQEMKLGEFDPIPHTELQPVHRRKRIRFDIQMPGVRIFLSSFTFTKGDQTFMDSWFDDLIEDTAEGGIRVHFGYNTLDISQTRAYFDTICMRLLRLACCVGSDSYYDDPRTSAREFGVAYENERYKSVKTPQDFKQAWYNNNQVSTWGDVDEFCEFSEDFPSVFPNVRIYRLRDMYEIFDEGENEEYDKKVTSTLVLEACAPGDSMQDHRRVTDLVEGEYFSYLTQLLDSAEPSWGYMDTD